MRLLILIILLSSSNLLEAQMPYSRDERVTRFTNRWENKDRFIDAWVYEKDGYRNSGLLFDVSDSTVIIAQPYDI